MAETFSYDLVAFLRVLYRRRYFIVKGTIAAAVLSIILSLVWPQTWRAYAKILVTTPKYKEQLRLIPKQFDVLTYRGIMAQDSLYQEIVSTLKWQRQAIHRLLQEPALGRMKQNLREKAQTLNQFQLIENTNIPLMTELLALTTPPGEASEPLLEARIYMLAHLSGEQIEELYSTRESDLDDLTVFDLRKMLRCSVAVIKETNLETIYSQTIELSADYNTAAGAAMMANTWIGLFEKRAEDILRAAVEKQIILTRESAAKVEIELASAEAELAEIRIASNLDRLQAEAASLLIHLTGVAPIHLAGEKKDEDFNLEDENQPFMKERTKIYDALSFEMTPQYAEALIPKSRELTKSFAAQKNWIGAVEKQGNAAPKDAQTSLLKDETELEAVHRQIAEATQQISYLNQTIRRQETKIAAMERFIQQKRNALQDLQPLLNEADLLENRQNSAQYRDVSVGRAIKPDKRVFPRRSIMVVAGTGLGWALFCGLAFFLDIWKQVIAPEAESLGADGREP